MKMKHLKLFEQYTNQQRTIEDFDIVKTLGKGHNGTAYLLSNGNVLKLTSNETEFENIEYIMEMDRPLNHLPVIFGCGVLESGEYYIEREYAQLLTPNEESFLSKMYDILVSHYGNDTLTDILYSYAHPSPEVISDIGTPAIVSIYREFSEAINELKDAGLILTDITVDFLGRNKDGKLIIIDIN
jgi:hypothetical protein